MVYFGDTYHLISVPKLNGRSRSGQKPWMSLGAPENYWATRHHPRFEFHPRRVDMSCVLRE